MSIYAARYAATSNIFGTQGKGRVGRKLRLNLRCLVVPNDGYGIFGLHTCAAAELFRWMVRTGDSLRARESRWGDSGPRELLDLTSGINCSLHESYRFTGDFVESLRERFQAALFGIPRSQAVVDWRKKTGLNNVYAEISVPIRHYKPMWSGGPLSSIDAGNLIDLLFEVKDRRLNKSWNSCHKKARSAHFSFLQCHPDGWSLGLWYGYRGDSSRWLITVAEQKRAEVFDDFVIRAKSALDQLL